jgi:23S rRNA (cytosine1962-C5)-methyltransferase
LKSAILHQSKTASVYRKHPWIFSGAIKKLDSHVEEGEIIEVNDEKSNFLGFGYYQKNNIAIKLLSFGTEVYSEDFWFKSIQSAYFLREILKIDRSNATNAYRLIHGEGDNLPGLIIDIYNDTAVIQCHSLGIYYHLEFISSALQNIYGSKLARIFNKSKDTLAISKDHSTNNEFLLGHGDLIVMKENDLQFEINLLESQKTGFFLDQRENRNLLMSYAKDKHVLNTFCYTGGFSLYAMKANCLSIDSVDSSSKAIAQLSRNIELNNLQSIAHRNICEDAIHFLNQMPSDQYDLIVLDPPAFAKNISKRHNAIQAYKRINIIALKKLKSRGVLFTFSCSQVVTEELFYNTLISAGIESGRNVRILHKLQQGPDHPINLYHPEGAYLKGLVLIVD